MTQLSNVPLNMLLTTENWITGAHGLKGKIVDIHTRPEGKHFVTCLQIGWSDGTESFPRFPEECDKLTVDETLQWKISYEYAGNQIEILDQYINYYNRFTDIKAIIGTGQ